MTHEYDFDTLCIEERDRTAMGSEIIIYNSELFSVQQKTKFLKLLRIKHIY